MSKATCHALLQELAATLATAEVASECWCAEPGEPSVVQRRMLAGLGSQARRIGNRLTAQSTTGFDDDPCDSCGSTIAACRGLTHGLRCCPGCTHGSREVTP